MTIYILALICIALIVTLIVSRIQLHKSTAHLHLFLDEALSGNFLKRFEEKVPTAFSRIGKKINGVMQALFTETELIENKLQEKNILMHHYIQFLLSIPTAYTFDDLVKRVLDGAYKIFRAEIVVMVYANNNIEHYHWHQVIRADIEKMGSHTTPFGRTYNPDIVIKNHFSEEDQSSALVPKLGNLYNLLQIPVKLNDATIGTIQIANKVSRLDFDDYDQEIARTISIAIANQINIISIIEEEKGTTEKLSTIIDSISDAIIITDANHRIVLENPAARDLFSLNPIKKLLILEKALSSTNYNSVNIVLFKPERVILMGKISTIVTPLGTVDKHIISLRNVTDAKQKEREKSEILFLTATKMYHPLLNLKKTKELFKFSSEPVLEEKLTTEINMVFDLLTKIIFYTEIEAGPMRLAKKPSNINEIIEKVIDSLGAQILRKNIKLTLKLDAKIEKVLLDFGRIEEVINSILQFMIKSTDIDSTHKEFKISTHTRNNEALMIDIFHSRFEFNNMEILELTNKNIQLEKFMQSDQALEELNLHFAFVNHVIKAHGGNFLVTSEPNIGTWYRFELPII